LVIADAFVDLPAPACASPCTYVPNSSDMSSTSVNLPRASLIFERPKVIPPPFDHTFTAACSPLSHVIVPVPLAVL
jgi:hypothetical protein